MGACAGEVPTLRSCIKFLAASVQRFPACARCCSTLPMGSWSMTISACSPSFSAFCRMSTAGQQAGAVNHRGGADSWYKSPSS